MVTANAIKALVRFPDKMARCAHVILTPEDNKINVFKKGNPIY